MPTVEDVLEQTMYENENVFMENNTEKGENRHEDTEKTLSCETKENSSTQKVS